MFYLRAFFFICDSNKAKYPHVLMMYMSLLFYIYITCYAENVLFLVLRKLPIFDKFLVLRKLPIFDK